ncbi:unnamed protein product [Absidia cylindrospora]
MSSVTANSTASRGKRRSIDDDDDTTVDPAFFRHKVYTASLKALANDFDIPHRAQLLPMVDTFKPATLGQHLDKMAATLLLGNLTSETNLMALKSSLSHVVDCINPTTKAVFQHHLNDPDLWKSSSVITTSGLSNKARQLFHTIMTNGKNDQGSLESKRLQQAICRLKLELLDADEQDEQCLQVLDVVDTLVRSCVDGTQSSGMTCYRKLTYILDIILKKTHLHLRDGENISRTSNKIIKDFGAKYDMPERRIEMVMEVNDIELSINEWKKKDTDVSVSRQHQSQTIRMNKALLTKWMTYSVPEERMPTLATLAMDWIGPVGYMFTVSPYQDVFVARLFSTLDLPSYVANLPDFIDTLDALYVWKHHHLLMKDILVPAAHRKMNRAMLDKYVSEEEDATRHPAFASPHVLFSPSKRCRTSGSSYGSDDDDDDDDAQGDGSDDDAQGTDSDDDN